MNTGTVFAAAWRTVPRLPETLVNTLAGGVMGAQGFFRTGPALQLERNLARLTGKKPGRMQLAGALARYGLYYAEAFRLPALTPEQIRARVRVEQEELLAELVARGPVVMALTHTGNWDLLGAWAGARIGPVLTVAEKLEPAELFAEFLAFRRTLGMEILGAKPGESVFADLVSQAANRQVLVPLLADRDITGRGIEVDFAGHRALVAAGPAALARRLVAPLLVGVISRERIAGARRQVAGSRWGLRLELVGPIPAPPVNQVVAHTQAWVDAVVPLLTAHARDWHMLQPVFVADLDEARLARARAKVAAQEQTSATGSHKEAKPAAASEPPAESGQHGEDK